MAPTYSTNQELATLFRAARNAGTPIVAIWTADPADAIERLTAILEKEAVLEWDLVRGISGVSPRGKTVVVTTFGKDASSMNDPAAMLRLLVGNEATKEPGVPRDTVIFLHNAPAYLTSPDVVQAIWNCRDPFKTTDRTLVLLGPDGTLPPLIEHDVTVLRDPLPSRDDLKRVLAAVHKGAGLAVPADGPHTDKVIDALTGLSAFGAEQIAAQSLSGKLKGVDLPLLRRHRRQAIENIPGLTVHRGTETLADYGGNRAAAEYFLDVVMNGQEKIKVIALFDEIDKAFGGAGVQGGPGDNTGVAQHQHGAILTHMSMRRTKGGLWYGLQGAGKTFLAQCLAGSADVELVLVNMGEMQTSAVGGSQERTKHALDVIDAIGQGQALFIGTCNSTGSLSTELLRRFSTYGEWMFDQPTPEELASIVKIKLAKYRLTTNAQNPLPDMRGWTGAEIDKCFYLCWNMGWPFLKAARFVVPIVISHADRIREMRAAAEGKFLSTTTGDIYTVAAAGSSEVATPGARSITLTDALEGAVAARVLGGMKES